MGLHYVSSLALCLLAFYLYLCDFLNTHNLVHLRGLLALSWIGGQGIACLQLSKLQTDWERETWLCFFLVYLCFSVGYDFLEKKGKHAPVKSELVITRSGQQARRVEWCIGVLVACSVICFAVEAAVVGFIPLFSDMPHAYSYFHISGVHYFTISCILIPGLSVIYGRMTETFTKKDAVLLLICNFTAVAIPILCVSRFQLLFAVGFAVVVYVIIYEKITWKMIVGFFAVMIPVYVLLTFARHHDVSYLNGIFEMKNAKIPIFVTQPYIYVANNFENFNCMVKELSAHTMGLRMLFPAFALTGMKFVFPQLVNFPIFITKTELTTVTMFYDMYYDFGVIGMAVVPLILGGVAAKVTGVIHSSRNPVSFLYYGQLAIYLGLSFFTTWFSNPTTWFWLILTTIMYWFVEHKKKAQ
ncbi:O-antigen polymerase [Hespellia stercorisuis]|nr:O-antigen polymerase [Hespellia stercorisuis]